VPAQESPAGASLTSRTASAARAVRAAARPAAMWSQLRRGLAVTGRATWYGASRGYSGIPHVAMPGARYLARGRSAPRARVCVNGRCAVLPVVDACGCHVGTPGARIVDLSVAALQRLRLDPGKGVYRVRVTLVEG
jgi:rare lipoprotein A (peptidoglycan hydrolase)